MDNIYDILNNDKISLYYILKQNRLITLLALNMLVALGIHLVIPIPTYPVLMLSQYIGLLSIVYIIYLFIHPNFDLYVPTITKKFIINIKLLKNDFIDNQYMSNQKNKKKNNLKYYFTLIMVLVLSIFVLIPVSDVIPANCICFVLFFYLIDNKKLYNISIIFSFILIILYSFFIKNFINLLYFFKNNYTKYLHLILILVIIALLYCNNQYKKLNRYSKYITIPTNFKFIDIFK